MTAPLDIILSNTNQVVSFSHASNLNERTCVIFYLLSLIYTHISQATVLHPGHNDRSVSPDTEAVALLLLLPELDSPGRGPVMLGAEHRHGSQTPEQVGHLVATEVGVGEGELVGGAGHDRGYLQRLAEVILVVNISILVNTTIVTQAENIMKRVLLPQLSTHSVDAESFLMLQQRLLQMSLACKKTLE